MSYLITIIMVLVIAGLALYFLPTLFPRLNATVLKVGIKAVAALAIIATIASGSVFYSEPGYNYHIRTAFGTESVSTTTGWKFHWFGRYEPWRKAISIATTDDATIQGESVSLLRPCWNVRMLDKVDGCLSTSVRFRMPDDEKNMLRLAREYRTQDNLINMTLVPAVNQVMNSTSQLMGAEEFYNGGRSTFDVDFDQQMRFGTFQVRRKESSTPHNPAARSRTSNNAALNIDGVPQVATTEDNKVIFEIEKLRDKDGNILIRAHNFVKFGVTVEDAIVTSFAPNPQFVARLESVQKASSDSARAREQRIQEEEQRLFVIAKSKREQAEIEGEALKVQIKATTAAETDKQLALTTAQKEKEQAAIQREAALIQLDRDRTRAKSQEVLADADAYAKRVVMEADNALEAKLKAEVAIQQAWATAFATRRVPTTVIGATGDTPTGGNTELQQILQLTTLEMSRRLSYDRSAPANADAPRPPLR